MAGTAGGTGRGRPRSVDTDEVIRRSALELLRVGGPAAVSIDAVAARSGAARTTIYRRFPSREQLLTAVLDELVEAELPAPTLPVAQKLAWVLQRVVTVLDEGIGRGGIAAVLTDSDPAFTSALRSRLACRLATVREAMAADVAAGRMAPSIDADTLVGLLFGAYLSELLRNGEPRPGWADRTVDLLTAAVAPT